MVALRLTLRGLWTRRAASASVLVVAVVAVAMAAAGPLYLHAGGDSITSRTLAAAPAVGNEVQVGGPVLFSHTNPDPAAALTSEIANLVPVRARRFFGAPVSSLQIDVQVPGTPHLATLSSRTAVCRHVRLVSGRCPSTRNEVMVSRVFTTRNHWRLGQRIDLGSQLPGQRVRVVGVYLPENVGNRFWGVDAESYFPSLSPAPPPDGAPTDDAIFTPRSTLVSGAAAKGSQTDSLTFSEVLPVRIGSIRRDDAATLSRATLSLVAALSDNNSGVIATSTVPTVLATARSSYDALRLPLLLVVGQLLILCWMVLFFVVAGAADARGAEIALAKVRGLPLRRTLSFGLSEILLLIVLAVPLGLAVGWAGTSVLVSTRLWPGTPTVLTWAGAAGAAAAAAGAAVAVVAATRRTLTRSVLEQWRRGGAVDRGRGWAVDVAVLVLTAAALVELLHTGVDAEHPDPIALLAPGLVVLVAALVGSRAIAVGAALGVRLTRQRGTAAFLGARQLARRPRGARLVLVLAIAFGLATFGVTAVTVSARNVETVAEAQVGASAVLDVSPPRGADLPTLVGRTGVARDEASVVDSFLSLDEEHAETLGVDPAGFAAVAAWPQARSPSPRRLQQLLAPPAPAPIRLSGERMEVVVTTKGLGSDAAIHLDANVSPVRGGDSVPVDLGALPHQGRVRLVGRLPSEQDGSVLRSLELVPAAAGAEAVQGAVSFVSVRVRSDRTWHRIHAGFTEDGRWTAGDRGGSGGDDSLVPTTTGLTYGLGSDTVVPPEIDAVDTPSPIPALVTSGIAAAARQGLVEVPGLDGELLTVHPVGVVPVLPGNLGPAVVVDRDYALLAGRGLNGSAQQQVWVSPGHRSAVRAALEHAGITVAQTTTSASGAALLRQEGPQLALLLLAVGAGLAALLTAAGVAVNLWLTGRRRSYEVAALKVAGLPPRTLYAAMLIEQAALVLGAAVIGVVAGVVAAVVALPAVPEFVSQPPSALLDFTPRVVPLALLLAGTLVVLVPVVAGVCLGLLRAARPSLLREAQP